MRTGLSLHGVTCTLEPSYLFFSFVLQCIYTSLIARQRSLVCWHVLACGVSGEVGVLFALLGNECFVPRGLLLVDYLAR